MSPQAHPRRGGTGWPASCMGGLWLAATLVWRAVLAAAQRRAPRLRAAGRRSAPAHPVVWLDCNSNCYGAYSDTAKQAAGGVVLPTVY